MRKPDKRARRKPADPLADIAAAAAILERDLAYWKLKLRVRYPRANQPWSAAEDRLLLKLVKKDLKVSLFSPVLSLAAMTLGRTNCALYARLQALRLVRGYAGARSPFVRKKSA